MIDNYLSDIKNTRQRNPRNIPQFKSASNPNEEDLNESDEDEAAQFVPPSINNRYINQVDQVLDSSPSHNHRYSNDIGFKLLISPHRLSNTQDRDEFNRVSCDFIK